MPILGRAEIITLAALYMRRPNSRSRALWAIRSSRSRCCVGLAILSCYGPDRPWRAIIDLAKELDMSPSTTHRYVKTLRAVGLLEQNPTTREYRPVAV